MAQETSGGPVAQLLQRVADRAKEMGDMKMWLLRKVVEGDPMVCRTRGDLLEWAIMEEFEEDARRIDDRLETLEEVK